MYVDGYNYLFKTNPDLISSRQLYNGDNEGRSNPAFDRARVAFHQQLKAFLQSADYDIEVVYDSSQAPEQTTYKLQDRLQVVYTSHKSEADTYIVTAVKQLEQQAAENPYIGHRAVYIISGDHRVRGPADDLMSHKPFSKIYAYSPTWLRKQMRDEQDRQRRSGLSSTTLAAQPASVMQKPAVLDTVKLAQQILQQPSAGATTAAAAAGAALGSDVSSANQHKGRKRSQKKKPHHPQPASTDKATGMLVDDEGSWARESLRELADDNLGDTMDAMLSDDFLEVLGIPLE
jgi:hypothetical protein